ncbi:MULTISPECIES: hypothetical protein [Streptomyces]|uniref:hypothetical protein n=1 Tax=Streptomyces TaxID=1883 RepID=UPI0034DFF428
MPDRRRTPAFRLVAGMQDPVDAVRSTTSGRRRTVGPSSDERCRNLTLAPVAARVPPVAGEIGENSRSPGFDDQVMKWFDDRITTWFDDRGLSYPGPDLEHLGLLHRSVPELGARQDTHRVRHRAA